MKVTWTQRALKSYFKVADYLNEEWGDKVLQNFETKVQTIIEQIEEMPNIFEESKKFKNIRKGFITKHNTLYYRFKPRKEEIELLIFWDNRQDDKKNPF